MRVLAAVLANARRIALDVAGIERRLVEWRREQQRQLILRPDQLAFDRRHGAGRALGIGRARDHRPGLRDRIDPAFVARRRAERRAVVEPGAPIPVAIPGLALERGLQRAGVRSPRCGAGRVAARVGERREGAERRVKQPAEPDALALAKFADAVHAVVPVAGADQRQSVRADLEAGIEPARAVLEQRADLVGDRRVEEAVVLVRPAEAALPGTGPPRPARAASPVAPT